MKRYSLWLMVAYFSILAISAYAADTESENLMFIGNLGVGKSSIINSLIGKVVSEPGDGRTKFFCSYEHKGKQYFDTPGLATIELREHAALEIENALKKDGKYRLFFVITLGDSQVMPHDVTTINIVMAAIKNHEKKFNVIINKITKLEKKLLKNDPKMLAGVYAAINSGYHKTYSIWCIDNDRDLENGRKDLMDTGRKLIQFVLYNSLAISIAKENITKIKTDEFEKTKFQVDANLSNMCKQIEAGGVSYKSLVDQMAKNQAYLNKKKIVKSILNKIRSISRCTIERTVKPENFEERFKKTEENLELVRNRFKEALLAQDKCSKEDFEIIFSLYNCDAKIACELGSKHYDQLLPNISFVNEFYEKSGRICAYEDKLKSLSPGCMLPSIDDGKFYEGFKL